LWWPAFYCWRIISVEHQSDVPQMFFFCLLAWRITGREQIKFCAGLGTVARRRRPFTPRP
jgi:hypothetical protein